MQATYVVIDFVFLSRQAVEELPIRISATFFAHLFGDLIAFKVAQSLFFFVLLAHGYPVPPYS